MSALTAAREWALRAHELLESDRLATAQEEIVGLREGLRNFASQQAVQDRLAPELTRALLELAGALSTATGPLSSPSAEAGEERQIYEDFREQFVGLRRSLEEVLTSAEAGTLDLALQLGASHARLQQFGPATTVLQQAWHRARAIRDEGRQGGTVEGRDEAASTPDLQHDPQPEATQAAIRKSSEKVAALVEQFDPMSRDEKLLCSLYASTLHEKLSRKLDGDALAVLDEWSRVLESLLKDDHEGHERRARRRQQQDLEQQALRQIEETSVAQAAGAIREELGRHRGPLVDLSRQISLWNGGQPHQLESELGALAFEVERTLGGLGREPQTEEEKQRCARLLVQAGQALKALEEAQPGAMQSLNQTKQDFQRRLAARKDRLADYLKDQDAAVAPQELEVKGKRTALDQHLALSRDLKDAAGRKMSNPFAPTSLEFYRAEVETLGAKEDPGRGKKPTLTDSERKRLEVARQVLKAIARRDELAQALEAAQSGLEVLQKQRDEGLKPLEEALEQAKLVQTLAWDPPADIPYGTALDRTQLDVRLSVDSGTVEYFAAGRRIVPGQTLLRAGAGQVLRAVVVGSDRDLYREVPPREVSINVLKARVTLSCAERVDIAYGTPFDFGLVATALATEPPCEPDQAGLLARLVWQADGQPLAAGDVLGAGPHAVTVRSPESENFQASETVAVGLTVTPARQKIVWDGAAPTTLTFGTPLTDKQLNATVEVLGEPPLKDRLAELTQALQYRDEQGRVVKVGSRLDAGDERRLTASTPERPDFVAAAPVTRVFRVEKAPRVLAQGQPDPIGAIVQAHDLKQLRSKFPFTAGQGEARFFIGSVQLVAGAKVAAGKARRLRVAAAPDDNYQPTAEREADIDVLDAVEKFTQADQKKLELLGKRIHSTHAQAVNGLAQQIEALGVAPDEQKFARIGELLEEMDDIEARLVRWQGAVPVAAPAGDADALKVDIDLADNPSENQKKQRTVARTVEVTKKMIKHGGLSLGDVERLVPKGTANGFRASGIYLDGFRYEWTTPSGVDIVIYGHGPTVAGHVDPDSDSKKGNLVRVMIDGEYLRPDGTLTAQSTDATSHLALY